MHCEHDWSHAAAYEHTTQQTKDIVGINWGGGLYFNYAMLVLWAADVGLQWRQSEGQRHFVSRLNEWFCAFMLLNATVVFGPWWWWLVAIAFGIVASAVRSWTRVD